MEVHVQISEVSIILFSYYTECFTVKCKLVHLIMFAVTAKSKRAISLQAHPSNDLPPPVPPQQHTNKIITKISSIRNVSRFIYVYNSTT